MVVPVPNLAPDSRSPVSLPEIDRREFFENQDDQLLLKIIFLLKFAQSLVNRLLNFAQLLLSFEQNSANDFCSVTQNINFAQLLLKFAQSFVNRLLNFAQLLKILILLQICSN